jgi:hypothetical protein
MLDVHPPHEKIHGFKDFLLHLLTITIGLLINTTATTTRRVEILAFLSLRRRIKSITQSKVSQINRLPACLSLGVQSPFTPFRNKRSDAHDTIACRPVRFVVYAR